MPRKQSEKKSSKAVETQEVFFTVGDRMRDYFQRRVPPEQVRSILENARDGNLIYQAGLFMAMQDSWPQLLKNIGEIKDSVARLQWSVQPWAKRGQKPSESATEKATFVDEALWNMRGDPVRNLSGTEQTIRDILDAWFCGHAVSEVLWETTPDGILPAKTKPLSAHYYRYPLLSSDEDRLMLNRTGNYTGTLEDFPEHKFLVSVRRTHGLHPTEGSLLRVLSGCFCAATFGVEWFMRYSKLFGVPQRVVYSDEKTQLAQIARSLENMAETGWAIFPEKARSETGMAPAGSSLPQERLLAWADSQCNQLILGQTLTSDVGDSGSRALGEVHSGIRSDMLESAAGFVGEVLGQIARSVVALNYGNEEEIPFILPVFEERIDPKAAVERDKVLFVDMGLPVAKAWLYERHKIQQPVDGEDLFDPKKEKQPVPGQIDPKTGEKSLQEEEKTSIDDPNKSADAQKKMTESTATEKIESFRADQARDKNGRWTAGGSASTGSAAPQKLGHPSEWVPRKEEKRIDPAKAREILKNGIEETSPLGHKIRFSDQILHHWETEKIKDPKNIEGRLKGLLNGLAAVRDPHEIWEQKTLHEGKMVSSYKFFRVIENEKGKKSYVAFTHGPKGEKSINSYYPNKTLETIEKARSQAERTGGKLVYSKA